MDRPQLKKYLKPKHIRDYPVGPCFEAGHLVTENSGWRTERPVIDTGRCTGCFNCYLYCPEGVIVKKDGKVAIDYTFCKGCGICARICLKKAVRMVREGEEDGQKSVSFGE